MSHTVFALILMSMPITAGIYGALRSEGRDGRTQAPGGHLPRLPVLNHRDRPARPEPGVEPGAPVRVLGQSTAPLPRR